MFSFQESPHFLADKKSNPWSGSIAGAKGKSIGGMSYGYSTEQNGKSFSVYWIDTAYISFGVLWIYRLPKSSRR
jgi:hypothetical protein